LGYDRGMEGGGEGKGGRRGESEGEMDDGEGGRRSIYCNIPTN